MSVTLSDIRKYEAILLNCAEDNNETPIQLKNVQHIVQGEFCKVLESPLCQEIFCAAESFEGSVEDCLLDCISDFVAMNCTTTDQLDVLCVGIASLQAFLQSNWTGPLYKGSGEEPLPWLPSCYQPDGHPLAATELARLVTDCLDLDGEGLCKVTEQPQLLVLARAVFRAELPQLNVSRSWWLLRCLLTHQRMLHETAPRLHSEMRRLADELGGCEDQLTSVATVRALLHLETCSVHVYYGEVVQAKQQARAAVKLLNLAISVVGALGRRTRFQEKSLAQLTVQVNVEREAQVVDVPEEGSSHLQDMPKDLRLDDDVRLNQIAFADEAYGKFQVLNGIEQAAIIAHYFQTMISQPVDKLRNEELLPYLMCVLSHPRVWSVQMAALCFRSDLESKERRTVERAMMQVQALVNTFDSSEAIPKLRLRLLFSSQLPPRWWLESLLGSILVSLNLARSALDVYLRLQSWPDVVSCYTKLQLRHKAADVLRQELAKGETPRLWCMLGDATDDPNCYERAWRLSGERSGQAQRHWGMYFHSKKQYAEAIPHLERSLSINSLQVELWSHLGYATMVEERWEVCAAVYRRYCSLEPDSFEAWNNLAKAYVNLGQKARAYRALQEAVKCNYDNWRIWDNLMTVSTDCGNFEEVIHCYHRILDLKEKHVDLEVLQILVRAIEQNLSDNDGEPVARLSKKVMALFGRLTAQVTNNSRLWRLYAQLIDIGEQTTETRHRTVMYLLTAHRYATSAISWVHEFESCLDVMQLCVQLTEACLNWRRQDSAPDTAMLVSTRFALKGVISLIKKHHEDISGEMAPQLVEGMNSLRAKLELVETELN